MMAGWARCRCQSLRYLGTHRQSHYAILSAVVMSIIVGDIHGPNPCSSAEIERFLCRQEVSRWVEAG